MQKIITATDTVFPEKYWQLTRAGKIFELHTTSTIDHKPDHYRLGVIQIGQIIQKIRTQIKNETTRPMIQIFPNISENQLIATVYWPELTNMNNIQISVPEQKTQDKETVTANLQLWARKNRLILDPIDHVMAGSILKKSTPAGTKNLLLLSESNHLFSWLRIGHWLEEAFCYAKFCEMDKPYPLFHIILTEEKRVKAEKRMKKKHIQGIISL